MNHRGTLQHSSDADFELVRQGRFAEAKPGLLRLVSRRPDDHEARLALAECFFWTGQASTAVFHLDQIVRVTGLREDLFSIACDLLTKSGASIRAVELLEARRRKEPGAVHVRMSLCSLYMTLSKLDEASVVLAEAERIFPDLPQVLRLRGALLSRRGDIEGSVEAFRRVMWSNPEDINLASVLAFTLNASDRATPAEVFQSHVMFGDRLAQQAGSGGFDFSGRFDPHRRLRLAFVSHDITGHSVASFLEAPLRHLARADFEVWLYHTGTGKDQTTGRLAACADRFVHAPGITSVDLAARVYADAIDVLIELNGHTVGHRLHAMQLRPAPLQATYLGYPNTTGLKTIDLRIVDAVTDPAGAEAYSTERLLRLSPCFLCYKPIEMVPERIGEGWVRAPRATVDGEPIFCCFNAAHKVNDRTLDLWSRVLRAVPRSRMLVKSRGASGPHSMEGMRKRFAERGVEASRIDFVPFTDTPGEHLNTYARADIQLDTFPYHGTTTTCESLLMGVPVVTRTGDRHVSRVSTSILSATGLGELACEDDDAFVACAARLAGDVQRLRRLQVELPERFRSGPVCDGAGFSAGFGQAIRRAWIDRCSANGAM